MRSGKLHFPRDRVQPIVAIGDVHGMTGMLAETLEAIDAEGAFPILLGDLVDKGPDSVGVLRLVLPRLKEGSMGLVRGNHDERLLQWLTNPRRNGKISPAHTDLMAADDAEGLASLTRKVLSQSPHWITLPGYVLVHGAFHIDMLTCPSAGDAMAVPRKLKSLALYAEVKDTGVDGALPVRTYNWVETIPPGLTVLVGHDTRQMQEPLVVDNAAGGRAVFLDTGAAKGGRLSTWRIPAL